MAEEQAWAEATKRLGDANKVIEDLRSIHLINAMEWIGRVVFLGLSIDYFESMGSNATDLVNTDSFAWMVGGGVVGYLLFAPRSWAKIQHYLVLGVLAGVAWGVFSVMSSLSDIERVGRSVAVIYIVIVYGAIFGKPKIIVLLGMIFICNFSMLSVFYASGPQHFQGTSWLKIIDYVNVRRMFEWAILGLIAGWPLFGRHHYISRLPHIAVVLMIVMHLNGMKNLQHFSYVAIFFEGTFICLTITALTLLCSREARASLLPFSRSRSLDE